MRTVNTDHHLLRQFLDTEILWMKVKNKEIYLVRYLIHNYYDQYNIIIIL